MIDAPERSRDRFAAWLAALLSFTLYLACTRPFVLSGDPGEFQTLTRVGGIAHVGYPLVTMLFQLAGHFPFGVMAFRANLLSCLCGAGAVGLAAFVATRFTGSWITSVVAALAFATARTPWKESTEASAHSIAIVLEVLTFLLALRYAKRASAWSALGIGVFGGFAVVSHFSALSLVPVILLAAFTALRAKALRAGHVAAALIGLAIGLSPLAYIVSQDRPGRPMNYLEDVMRLEPAEFIPHGPLPTTRIERAEWLLSGAQYFAHPLSTKKTLMNRVRNGLGIFVVVVLDQFPLWGVPLGLWGLWTLLRRRSAEAAMLVTWLVGAFALTTWATDGQWISAYFFFSGLWCISIGIAAALDTLARVAPRPVVWIAGALLLTAPWIRLSIPRAPGILNHYTITSAPWTLWPEDWSPLRPERRWDDYGRAVMAKLPSRSAVLVHWAEGNVLRYFVFGDRLRPDVEVIHTGSHPGRVQHAVRQAEAEGRPIFATFPPHPETARWIHFTRTDSLEMGGLWSIQLGDSAAAQ